MAKTTAPASRFSGFISPNYTPVPDELEATRDEQNYRHSRVFLTLQPFHFLLGQAHREGELPTALEPVTIAHMDAGQYVDKERTSRIRDKLTARDGTPEEAVHREISERRDRCVCLARPAFHNIVHPQREARHPHAPGVSRPPSAHPTGDGQAPARKAGARPEPASTGLRPEPGRATHQPSQTGRQTSQSRSTATGQERPRTEQAPYRTRFSRR